MSACTSYSFPDLTEPFHSEEFNCAAMVYRESSRCQHRIGRRKRGAIRSTIKKLSSMTDSTGRRALFDLIADRYTCRDHKCQRRDLADQWNYVDRIGPFRAEPAAVPLNLMSDSSSGSHFSENTESLRGSHPTEPLLAKKIEKPRRRKRGISARLHAPRDETPELQHRFQKATVAISEFEEENKVLWTVDLRLLSDIQDLRRKLVGLAHRLDEMQLWREMSQDSSAEVERQCESVAEQERQSIAVAASVATQTVGNIEPTKPWVHPVVFLPFAVCGFIALLPWVNASCTAFRCRS